MAAIDRPKTTTSLVPIRSTTRADRGAKTIIVADIGSSTAPALSARVAEHRLEVLGQQEDHAEQRHERERDAAAGRAEPRVGEEAEVEHRRRVGQLPDGEGHEHDGPDAEADEHRGRAPAAGRPLDDRPQQRRQPDDREDRAERVEREVPTGRASSGMNFQPSTSPTRTTGTLTSSTAPHQKCSSRNPPVTGPTPTPIADTPAQTPIARPRSLRVGEDVGDDRQRRRHDQRAADAHEAAPRRSAMPGRSRTPPAPTPRPNTARPIASAP